MSDTRISSGRMVTGTQNGHIHCVGDAPDIPFAYGESDYGGERAGASTGSATGRGHFDRRRFDKLSDRGGVAQ